MWIVPDKLPLNSATKNQTGNRTFTYTTTQNINDKEIPINLLKLFMSKTTALKEHISTKTSDVYLSLINSY